MSAPSSLRSRLAWGGAVALAIAVYLNGLHNPFVYDDYRTIVGNGSIQQLGNVRAIFWHDATRPLVNFSYALDYAVWGDGPFGFHLTSVLLHALNVALLFRLVFELTSREARTLVAFVAAALFALHPMMTEAVGYISGRSEVLCATFFLLALLAGRRWLAGNNTWWAIATVGWWAASLATKETAAVFPLVFAAYDWLSGNGDLALRRRRVLRVHFPLLGVVLLAGLVRLVVLARVEYPGDTAMHWPFVLLAVDVAFRYVALLLVPTGQAAFHAVPNIGRAAGLRVALDAGSFGLALALIWRCRSAEWMASFGMLWFLLALLPSSALIVLGLGEPMTEHRVYLASCGLFVAAGAAFGRLWSAAGETRPRVVRVGLGAAVVLVLAAFASDTIVRNAIWRDPVGLWREAVDRAPDHYRPRLLLGEALQDAGKRNDALEQFQIAVRLRPAMPDGYLKAGLCLISLGRLQEARPYLTDALARNPENDAARLALALLDRLGAS